MFSPTPIPRSGKPSWRESVRRAVDLVVAFATLEDGPTPSAPRGHAGAARHPHRQPLRAPTRAGRPGTVAQRALTCRTPQRGATRRTTISALR